MEAAYPFFLTVEIVAGTDLWCAVLQCFRYAKAERIAGIHFEFNQLHVSVAINGKCWARDEGNKYYNWNWYKKEMEKVKSV